MEDRRPTTCGRCPPTSDCRPLTPLNALMTDEETLTAVMTDEEKVRMLATARGSRGPCFQYLFDVVAGLRGRGVVDERGVDGVGREEVVAEPVDEVVAFL